MSRSKLFVLVLLALLSVVVPSGSTYGQSSPRSPEGGECPPPVACDSCCRPTPENPSADYTCRNPSVRQHVNSNIDLCLDCSDALLRKAAACGLKCPLTSCPPGQYLWEPDSPNCKCLDNRDICSELGDVSLIGVQRWHSDINTAEQINAFVQSGVKIISGSGVLVKVSPCMEKVRQRCSEMFYSQHCGSVATCAAEAGEASGFLSYRNNQKYAFLDTCISSALQVSLGATRMTHVAYANQFNVYNTSGYVYANCAPVEQWKTGLLKAVGGCGKQVTNFNELTSPVSLLWSSEVKIGDVLSRSKFPLNPSEAGRWFVWRASGLTPLVVWDPEHKGEITQASQLFGNYTWNKKWKNGYEALATLDGDLSGWLEEGELDKLALWFDFNQDGISDLGEVKRLGDVGVTAIGVKSSYEDSATHNIFADQGYKRSVNGNPIQGLSVDWFTGSTEERLGLEALYSELPVVPAALVSPDAAAKEKQTSGVAGFWDWRVVDRSGAELPENLPHGSLILYETEDGVKGSSFLNQQLVPNRGGIGEKVTRLVLTGNVISGSGSKVQVTFSATTAKGGKAETIAQLSDDKLTLRGVTTEEGEPGQEKIQYGWVARRHNS